MEHGFAPVYGKWCRVLILGSFPSVRSRAVGFYYGHPQNRFWKTVCGYFGESVPETISGKTDFLMRCGIALWDVVEACEIEGSSDASIREESVGDLKSLFDSCGAEKILCNGSKSFQMLEKHYPELLPYTKKLSSTSPANPRFSEREWFAALQEAGLH